MPNQERHRAVQFAAAVIPGATEAVVHGAAPGGHAALALGTLAQRTPLPGGTALGLVPAGITSYAPIDTNGCCALSASFPPGSAPGTKFLAQAVLLAPGMTIGQPGALAVTPVRELRIPELDAEAPVFVLFGQSNLEGQAPVADLPPPRRGPHPTTRIWHHTSGTWQALHAGRNNNTLGNPAWVGPEMALARELGGDRVVWIVKFAVGQTSLGPTPGPWNEWDCRAGELYAELLRRIDAATTAIRSLRLRPRVRGICMMQGENDAIAATLATGYRARLLDLVQTLRQDLAARGLTDAAEVPFVLGLVNATLARRGATAVDVVRTAQLQAVEELAVCSAIDTTGMALQPDGVHLATAGVEALGRAFAAALHDLGAV